MAVKLDFPQPMDHAYFAALLPSVLPVGSTVKAKRDGWLVASGNHKMRIRMNKARTRANFTMETPGWAFALIFLGLAPFIVAVFVFDAAVKPFAKETRGRLVALLQAGAPPGPLTVCPFCSCTMAPGRTERGELVCPFCRNTGKFVVQA